jgi:hypothetical protein
MDFFKGNTFSGKNLLEFFDNSKNQIKVVSHTANLSGNALRQANVCAPRGTPDRRRWSPTQEGSAFFDGKSGARGFEKRRAPRQKQRNLRRSLALPEGVPFSFVTFLLGKQKKSKDTEGYHQSRETAFHLCFSRCSAQKHVPFSDRFEGLMDKK